MVGRLTDLLFELINYLFSIVVMIWPVLLIVFAWRFGRQLAEYYGNRLGNSLLQRQRFKKMGDDSSPEEILHKVRTLHPKEFEYYIADVLTKNGYREVKVTGGHGKPDGGVDIVAQRDGEYCLVQCKKLIDFDVGVNSIREFYGVGADLRYAKGAKMIFVATTYFTQGAIEFAKKKDITLVDADYLVSLIFAQETDGNKIGFNGRERSEVMRQVSPACPVCTRPLAWRRGPHGNFVGCKGYPQCRYVFSRPDSNLADAISETQA